MYHVERPLFFLHLALVLPWLLLWLWASRDRRPPKQSGVLIVHYRNGREAKPGDKVVWLDPSGAPRAGLLHSLNAQASTCNARLAQVTNSDPYVNLSDCVHADDVAATFPKAEPK